MTKIDDKEKIRLLEEQVEELKKKKHSMLEALEMAATLGNFRISLNRIDDPTLIIKETASQMRRFIDFKSYSFYLVNEEDSDFYQAYSEPDSDAVVIDNEVQHLIEDETFSWALSRNKPVRISSNISAHQLVLHSLNTSSRTRGIFTGILAQPEKEITDLELFLFSLTMIACSNALESFELYRQIRAKNKKLSENILKLEESGRELQESEGKYRALFEEANNPIVLYDMDTRSPVEFNDKAHNILGYTREEYAGLTIDDYDTREKPDETNEHIQLVQREGQDSFETRHRRRDGEYIDVLVNSRHLRLKGKDYILSFIADLSEQKRNEGERLRLEKELRQAQKMESIGTLAGGIAHDFNNILAIILGYAELSLLDIPKSMERIRHNMEQLVLAVDRARKLVGQILTFSRESDEQLEPLVVNSIVAETLTMLRATLPTTIDILQKVEEEPFLILGNATQLHQVVMNLCSNAAHAMDEGKGVLTVEVKRFDWLESDEDLAFPFNLPIRQGSYVQITVSDTGHGIHPDVVDRVFDPYFTTKDAGQGTGLGLSVVHGIITSYDGHIGIESTLNQGTMVLVLLPILDPSAAVEGRAAKTGGLVSDSDTILL